MAVCNSHSGIQKSSVSSYEAVFRQKYHIQLKCKMSEICECKSIFQRLKLSPNERTQHDIVNIEIDDTEFNEDNDDNPYDSENEGEEMDENAFPELLLEQNDYQIGNIYNDFVFDGMLALVATATSVVAAAAVVVEAAVPTTKGSGRGRGKGSGSGGGVSGGGGVGIGYFCGGGSGGGSGSGLGSGSNSGKVVVTTTMMEDVVAGVTSVAMAAMAEATVVDTPLHDVFNQTPTCQLTFDSPQPVVNEATEQETIRARVFSTFTVQEAWDHGNIACLFQPLCSHGEFRFLWPVLTFRDRCFPHGKPFIQIGNDEYISSITKYNKLVRWCLYLFFCTVGRSLRAHHQR